MMDIAVASRSEVGARSRNEDDLRHGTAGPHVYLVLADGAGGHSNGAMASDIVVRSVALALARARVFNASVIEAAVEEANDILNAGQEGFKAHQRMHATVVALWVHAEDGLALWAHVGDSRLYRVRQGRTEQLTVDDSVVQHMVDAGFIKPEEARHHPRKNQLLAALGSEDPPSVHVTREPQPLHDGDAFLLCSDGWGDAMDPAEIAQCVERAANPDQWLDLMAEIVVRRQPPNQDNYSALALWVGNPGDVTRVG
jgi:serine/threonine protein phosphatase PrpC